MAEKKQRSRDTTYRKLQRLNVSLASLNPPPKHESGRPWTEEEAIAEMEFLVRYVSCGDPKKLFFSHALHDRGYTDTSLYKKLSDEFGGRVRELYEFANAIRNEKIAMNCLNKQMDSKFGIFAMQNLAKWKTNAQLDTTTYISITTKDYKGIQDTINDSLKKRTDARTGGRK